jgi:Fe-S-cluster-containing hydrogenase component 2
MQLLPGGLPLAISSSRRIPACRSNAMCESVPPLAEPMCVQVCEADALVYEEREVEREEKPQEKRGQIEIGLESLVHTGSTRSSTA